MPHRAEIIMAAVETVLTGLVTTGTNVQRARVYELSDLELPGLTLNMGEDLIVGDGNMSFIDRDLHIDVIAHVKASADIDVTLNAIRSEVHQALYADYTQGLSFVLSTKTLGDDKPELSGEGEKPVARQVLNYAVQYRHNVNDPDEPINNIEFIEGDIIQWAGTDNLEWA